MSKELDVKAILCSPTTSPKVADAVTFLAVVRPGKDDQTFSLSLHNNTQWIDMNVADVVDARDHGSVDIDGTRYKLATLTIPRPQEAGVWFDLFKDAVSSLADCVVGTKTTCGCSQEPSPGPIYRQNRRPVRMVGVNGDCYKCKLVNGDWRCVWVCSGSEPR